MALIHETAETPAPALIGARPFPWRPAIGLFFACVVGTFAMIPFTYALVTQMKFPGVSFNLMPALIAFSLVVDAVISLGISAAAIGLGLYLGGKVGIRRPLLDGFGGVDADRGRALKALGLGAILGTILGGVILACSGGFDSALAPNGESIQLPAAWEGFLASIGAGVREEVWLRLGLMTTLIWLFSALTRRPSPGAALVWVANFLAALAFAAIHLPQAAQLFGLTVPVVAFVFIGNGVPGVVFGWLYWRKGLVSAMVAHFFLDIVLKVMVPVFGL